MKFFYIIDLFAYFLWELIRSNLRVLSHILLNYPRLRPAFIELPLSLKSSVGITVYAQLITLTPGTLSVDVSDDRKFLVVHTLFLNGDGFESEKKSFAQEFERRVRKVFP